VSDSDREAYEYYADPANRELRGTPRKRKAPRLTGMTSVRFDPAAIEAAAAIAHAEGITVSSWIRRLVQREIEPPRLAEVADAVTGERYPVPADALERVAAALLPALVRHGCVTLQIGTPRGHAGAERPAGIIRNAGRKGEPKALPSSLELKRGYGVTTETGSTIAGRTFACPHLGVGNAASASCGTCGPLEAA
jgi:hypothetical protein